MGDFGDGEGQDQGARPGGVSEWTPVWGTNWLWIKAESRGLNTPAQEAVLYPPQHVPCPALPLVRGTAGGVRG